MLARIRPASGIFGGCRANFCRTEKQFGQVRTNSVRTRTTFCRNRPISVACGPSSGECGPMLAKIGPDSTTMCYETSFVGTSPACSISTSDRDCPLIHAHVRARHPEIVMLTPSICCQLHCIARHGHEKVLRLRTCAQIQKSARIVDIYASCSRHEITMSRRFVVACVALGEILLACAPIVNSSGGGTSGEFCTSCGTRTGGQTRVFVAHIPF